MPDAPLAGLRVIDFSWVGAGSFTTRLLAEHGADVVKIESSTHVDSLRLGPPFAGGVPGVNRSGYFAERNANKRSVTIDLKSSEGLSLARRLVTDADVVANNFRPGVMDALGLGYDDVRSLNPRVIYLAMSMQGATGPESTHLGYGITIAAISGLTAVSGEADRYPVGTGTHYPDHVPNPTHAAVALLAAVRHQRRTGEGQYIELAQTEPMIASLGPVMMEWTANGVEHERAGNRDAVFPINDTFRVAGVDRWVAVSARTEAEAEIVRGVLGPELDAGGWEAADLVARLRADGIPVSVVQNARDLIEGDRQLRHRGHWRSLDHPEMGRALYGVSPFRLSRTPGDLSTPAPLLGQHTAEVLRELLGLSDEELDRLAADGVLS